MDAGTILREALTLSEHERMFLVEKLLETFQESSDALDDEAFEAEMQRRGREVDDGIAELIPWSDLKGRTE